MRGFNFENDLDLAQKKRLWAAFVVAACLVTVWLVKDFRWHVVWESGPFLLKGLAVSWLLAIISIAIGLAAAIPLAWARVYGPAGIRHAAVGMIELVRATPELMIVFWIFFAFPGMFGVSVSSWTAGLTALSIIATAYLAEVIRGGLYSVPQSQWDAGISTGLSKLQSFRYVVLPQALRNMVPALIGQFVILFKATALVYVIGVVEFFRTVTLVNNAAFAPFALYTTMAICYFTCCWLLTLFIKRFDPDYMAAD